MTVQSLLVLEVAFLILFYKVLKIRAKYVGIFSFTSISIKQKIRGRQKNDFEKIF
jgi:hypothetical protein